MFFVLALQINYLKAQNRYEIGGLPTLNFNKKITKKWSVNFQYATRHLFKSGDFGGDSNTNYDFILSDYTLLTSKKVGLNNKLTGGLLYRREQGETILRAIQQFTIVRRYANFRLAHRFVTDQTFEDQEDFAFRFRYRLASEIPLNGNVADTNEFYLKINNEYLQLFQGNQYDIEIRFIPMLGYVLKNGQKVEFGLDYRVNNFMNADAEHTFWTGINWFIQL